MTEPAESPVKEWHLIPMDEINDHDHSDECWCEPEYQGEAPEGGPVWLHIALKDHTFQ